MKVRANLRELIRKMRTKYDFIIDQLPEEYWIDVDRTFFYCLGDLDFKIDLFEYSIDEGEAEFNLTIYNDAVEYKARISVLLDTKIKVVDTFFYQDKKVEVPPQLGRYYDCH